MKILKEGSREKLRGNQIKNHRIFKFECEMCGCIYEADLDEGEVKSSQWDGTYSNCPFCDSICYYKGE